MIRSAFFLPSRLAHSIAWIALFTASLWPALVADFEDGENWRIQFRTNVGEARCENIEDRAHGGNRCLSVRLSGVRKGGSFQFAPARATVLGDLPKRLALWAFGTPSNQGVSFLVQITDAHGETHQWALGRIQAPGWNRLSTSLNPSARHAWGGDSNWEAESPVSLKCLVAAFPADSQVSEIAIDDFTAESEPARTASVPPAASSEGTNAFPMVAPEIFPVFRQGDRGLGASMESRVWDATRAERASNEVRARICLNGLWRFLPGDTNRDPPAQGAGWGWLKVPGGWPTSHRWGLNPYAFVPLGTEEWDRVFGIPDAIREHWWFGNEKRGAHIPWDGIRRAWYRRTVAVPADWAGKAVRLRARNVEQQARLYVNGSFAGSLAWPGGSVGLEQWVRPGATNVIALHVSSSPRVEVRGLAGDLFLEAGSPEGCIEDAYVDAAMADGAMRLRFWVRCALDEADSSLSFRILTSVGDVPLAEFPPVAVREALATNGAGHRCYAVSWPGGRPWSFEDPRLYRYTVGLFRGRNLVDRTLPAPFGMRSFEIQGKECRLNGARTAFRSAYYRGNLSSFAHCDREAVESLFRAYRAVGINLVSPANYSVGAGSIFYMEEFFDAADRLGMGVLLQLPRWADFDKEGRNPEAARLEWKKSVSFLVDEIGRRHPSVLLFGFNQSLYHYVDEGNPLSQGRDADPEALYRGQRPADYHAFLKPWASNIAWTTGYLAGQLPGAVYVNIGDGAFAASATRSIYLYMNHVPTAELRNWFSRFEADGDKPLFLSEWGAPATASFTLYRNNNPHPYPAASRIGPQPVPVEALAAIVGEEAWADAASYRRYHGHVESVYAKGTNFHLHDVLRDAPGAEAFYRPVQARQLEEVLPYWRYAGLSQIVPYEGEALEIETVTRGLAPTEYTNYPALQRRGLFPDRRANAWVFRETPLAETYRRVFMPVVAAWGGAPAEPYADERPRREGEPVAKSVLFVNDAGAPRKLALRVWLEGAAPMEIYRGSLTLGAGERKTLPFAFVCPAAGTYRLRGDVALEGDRVQSNAWLPDLPFQALRRPAAPTAGCVLWDPRHRSAGALRDAGIPFRLVEEPGAVEGAAFLCVGSGALDGLTPQRRSALERANAPILVLEQSEEALWKCFGLRGFRRGFREAFPGHEESEELRGLDVASLQLWRGASTLVEAYQSTHAEYVFEKSKTPWYGEAIRMPWKWGNGQTVASVAVERPQRGPWLSRLHCGFDLQYSVLLAAVDRGRRVILCQADVSARTENDPAAAALLRNLAQAVSRPAPPARALRILGTLDAGWRDLLPIMESPMSAPLAGTDLLLVLPGCPAGQLAGARSHAERGGVVLGVGLSMAELEAMLPATLYMRTGGYRCLDSRARLNALEAHHAPLGLGDFALRSEITATLIDGCRAPGSWFTSPGVYGEIPLGKGRVVLLQIDPRALRPAASAPYKDLSFLKSVRALHNLMASEGAPSQSEVPLWVDQGPGPTNPRYVNVPRAEDQFYRWQWW